MLRLSDDPSIANDQLSGLILYLTALGYADGDFDGAERQVIERYIQQIVAHRVQVGLAEHNQAKAPALIERYTNHFNTLFQHIEADVQDMLNESIAYGEEQSNFIASGLKLRCFEALQGFDRSQSKQVLDAVDELLLADGFAHPAELKLRQELLSSLDAIDQHASDESRSGPRCVTLRAPEERELNVKNHPLFPPLEQHFSAEPRRLMAQLESDLELISKAQALLAQQRAQGEGRLNGVQSAAEFAGSEDFLDGYVYGLPSKAGQRYELTILGDLHGCYSCLKAAIFQSRFLERVAAYRQAPHDTPFPRLVMLGDYIDRGRFSLDGVLRAVLTLFLHAPEHVHLLRGNHEFYVEHQGSIYGGVTPAEAIYSLKSHVPLKVLRSYKSLFDALPSVALIDGIVCVHGGAPRDSLLKTKWDDLSSLNLSECRFQMMWSDARRLDVVPAALQGATTRFAFGRLQAQAFLGRLGCHTMIRGHSRVENGFQVEYDDDKMLVMTVFSAGGADNEDIPTRSNYRLLTPMALSLSGCDGEYTAQPWPIDYAAYNHPDLNGFYAHKPELPMRRRPL